MKRLVSKLVVPIVLASVSGCCCCYPCQPPAVMRHPASMTPQEYNQVFQPTQGQ